MINKCPDEEHLADYLEGRLPPDLESRLNDHLAACDLCLEGILVTRNLVREEGQELEPVPEKVTRSTLSRLGIGNKCSSGETFINRVSLSVRKGLDWFVDLVDPSPEAHLVPVRGGCLKISESLVRVEKTFKKIDIEIEIEKTDKGKANIRVYARDAEKIEEVRVTLKTEDREISSLLLDQGYAIIEDVPFGQHRMIFSKNRKQLGIYSFEIRESQNGRN